MNKIRLLERSLFFCICSVLALSFLTTCNNKKAKKNVDTSFDDQLLPSDWDGNQDWNEGHWQVRDF